MDRDFHQITYEIHRLLIHLIKNINLLQKSQFQHYSHQ